MSRKLIFIDVDCTLCDSFGQVPESAKEAIKIARSNGHLVYICTGSQNQKLLKIFHL